VTEPDVTPARGDVVSGVSNRPEWMGHREWTARCWANAMADAESPLANSLVRVFKLLDDARADRDANARDAARWRALFVDGGRVRMLGWSGLGSDGTHRHIGVEFTNIYPQAHLLDRDSRERLAQYADEVIAIKAKAE
jgi:hypothetical protein